MIRLLYSLLLLVSALPALGQTASNYYRIAESKSLLGDEKSAIAFYTKALDVDPGFLDAYIARATSRVAIKDYKGAIEDCTKALTLDSRSFIAWYLRGLSRSAQEDYMGSLEDYNEFLSRTSDGESVGYLRRGISKIMLQDYRGADLDLTRAIVRGSSTGEAFLNRGIARMHMGNTSDGCGDLSVAARMGEIKAHPIIEEYCK
ncbi:tetratricopeptide repeat protein [Telluribacter humicola]|uniref:tetratricopeptide repeat protein n=1 Tax=Telluribacter humicola TaxID=1720261 RepID=UPI001A970CD5|nr:hypothetical protein [Telluribacter humicola]